MNLELSIRAGNYYTNLLEQGVSRVNAIEFTRLQFGLNDEELRHVVAHNFLLAINHESISDDDADNELSDLLLTYAEAREARSDRAGATLEIAYYGD